MPFDIDDYNVQFGKVFGAGRPVQRSICASWSTLRSATWSTAALFGIPPPEQHNRYARRRVKAVATAEANDVACFQDTHGNEFDAAAFFSAPAETVFSVQRV